MNDAVNRFFKSIENASNQNKSKLVELFVYFLTVEMQQKAATHNEISDCFSACDLVPPKGLSARLSEGLKSNPVKFIKVNGGYRLQRHFRETLSKGLGAEQRVVQTSATLRGLEHKLTNSVQKSFLRETIDCFEVGANRATIVMAWILTLDHLFTYVLKHKLIEFNASLAKNTGVKLQCVRQRDDFCDLRESKFIEICRGGKVISSDVKKILDNCLGVRNSCAHPSGIQVPDTKVLSVVEDLVSNVMLKYEV